MDALQADDQCSTADGGPGCALSALQLSSQEVVAAERRSGAGGAAAGQAGARMERVTHHPGVSLQSSFFVGTGISPYVKCNAEDLNTTSWRSALASSFGAGGGGASWQSTSLVIFDGPPRGEVDLKQPVRLELTVTANNMSWTMPGTLNVDGMGAELQTGLKFVARGTQECPPAYCLMHEPTGKDLSGRASQPHCGWAAAEHAVSVPGPSAGTKAKLLLDITELVAKNYTAFKVWAAPSELARNGMWQTAEYKVTSWGFSWARLH